ncbi:hypothetical protein ETECTG_CDS0182 [Escherichia phage ETEC-TG]|nr:hypothetical protein ETECTG_CDS0182 [Escherichia phage ETEC-TG]
MLRGACTAVVLETTSSEVSYQRGKGIVSAQELLR